MVFFIQSAFFFLSLNQFLGEVLTPLHLEIRFGGQRNSDLV